MTNESDIFQGLCAPIFEAAASADKLEMTPGYNNTVLHGSPSGGSGSHSSVFHTVVFFILELLGMVGNLLIVAVMLRDKFRQLSFALFMVALALLDASYNLMILVVMLVKLSSKLTLTWLCNVYNVMNSFTGLGSSWVVMTITIERLLLVTWPHSARSWLTQRNATIALVTVLFLSATKACLDVYYLATSTIHFDRLCYPKETNPHGLFANFLTHAMLYTVVPFISVAVCNMVVVYKIWRQAAFRSAAGANSSQANNRQYHTFSLLLVCTASVLLTVPTNFLWLCGSWSPADREFSAVGHILNNLDVLNHAANFYLYCVAGSTFRQELTQMVRGACKAPVSEAGETATSRVASSHT